VVTHWCLLIVQLHPAPHGALLFELILHVRASTGTVFELVMS
jgi:hypothetical protein